MASTQVNTATFQGEQGPPGPKGMKGDKGVPGLIGNQGKKVIFQTFFFSNVALLLSGYVCRETKEIKDRKGNRGIRVTKA